jgi:O-antigen ligase
VGGAIGGPNTAAGYLALLLPMALAVCWSRLGGLTRTLAFLALGLGCVGLGLTLSRGGTISAVIGLTIVFVLCWRRQGWSLGLLSLLAVVSGLVLYFGAGLLFAERMIGVDQGAAAGRLPLITLAFQIIRDAPLLGIGANNFAVVMPDYLTPEFSRDWLYIVHNKYLLIWAELGPVGIGAYLWFLLSTLYLGWRTWQQRASLLAPLALGLSAGMIGHMIHMQVDLFNGRQLVQMLWLQATLIMISAHLVVYRYRSEARER